MHDPRLAGPRIEGENPELAEQAYANALEAQPLNFPVWVDSVDFLKESRKPDAESWEIIGKSISTALAARQELESLGRHAGSPKALAQFPCDQHRIRSGFEDDGVSCGGRRSDSAARDGNGKVHGGNTTTTPQPLGVTDSSSKNPRAVLR